jgi:hypothetical protein
MKTVDITTLSVIELKAMVYDEMIIVERAQANIQALNQEIAKKSETMKIAK